MFTNKVRFSTASGPLITSAASSIADLTVLYAAVLGECDEAVAQAVLRAVVTVDRACRTMGTTWLGSVEDIRTAIGHALQSTNQTKFYARKGTARLYPANAHTARTALSHLKYAYDVAITVGLYDAQPLIGKGGYPYFRVNDTSKRWPEHILDNPELPQIIRKYARLAHITQAETAVYEGLLSNGPRVAEICSTNLKGARHYKTMRRLDVRNKCAGTENTKSVALSSAAIEAIDIYISGDLKIYDPFLKIHAPNNNKGWTIDEHLKLAEQKNIDIALKPLFYTQACTPLTPNAFRYSWRKIHDAVPDRLRSTIPLVKHLHDLRFWYINAELDRINAAFQNDFPRHVAELRGFISAMEWKRERSLEFYDIRKIASRVLEKARNEQSVPTTRTAQVDLKARRAQLEAAEAAGLGFRRSEKP